MRALLTGSLLLQSALFGVGFGLIVSFAYAAIYGPFGIAKHAELEMKAEALTVELAALHAEKARLENRVRRMSDDFLDLDLLDEQARRDLMLLRPDELILR